MLFFEALMADVAAAIAAGKKPDTNAFEKVRPGEEVVSVVSDLGILAMMAVYEARYLAFLEKWPVIEAEEPAEMAARKDIAAVGDAVWHEICRGLPEDLEYEAGGIGFRLDTNGELVVARLVEPAQKPICVPIMVIDVSAMRGASDSCGDPNCSACNSRFRQDHKMQV
jgi:hypothetical protein